MSNENSDQTPDIHAAKAVAKQLLRTYRLSGLQTLPKPQGRNEFGFAALDASTKTEAQSTSVATGRETKSVQSSANPAPNPAAAAGRVSKPKPESDLQHYQSQPAAESDRVSKLQLIETEVSNCTKCPELSSCRKNTVFGVGNPTAQLCFLGEGPGADEDRQGEPFVGAAGQLLNRIIEACKMKREDVYILNTVKCRPPGNRNPGEEELANCWPYAIEQLEILQPEFICCLGSVAAKTLLQTKQSIGRMRGQFFKFRGSQVIVTYHPAYLLRNPSAKRQVWDDMKILMSAMGR